MEPAAALGVLDVLLVAVPAPAQRHAEPEGPVEVGRFARWTAPCRSFVARRTRAVTCWPNRVSTTMPAPSGRKACTSLQGTRRACHQVLV